MKKLGRPKKEKLPNIQELPKWAVKRIEELSGTSGVSPKKILELALKMGLYAVAEQYAGLIQFQASADELFFGSKEEPPDEPLPVTRSVEETEDLPEPESEPVEPPEPEPEVQPDLEPELEEATQNGSYATALQ